MAKDKRTKGCSNENCEMHINKKKMSAENEYCPKCGTELMYVCSKCFKEIEDNGPEHKLCMSCEADADAKKEKMKDAGKKIAGKTGAVVATIVTATLAGMEKEGVKQAAKAGGKLVQEAVKKII